MQPDASLPDRVLAFERRLERNRIALVDRADHATRCDEYAACRRVVCDHVTGVERLVPARHGCDEVRDRHVERVCGAERAVVRLVGGTGAVRVEEAVGRRLVVVRRTGRGLDRECRWPLLSCSPKDPFCVERNGTRRPRNGNPWSSRPRYGTSSPCVAQRTSSDAKHEARRASSGTDRSYGFLMATSSADDCRATSSSYSHATDSTSRSREPSVASLGHAGENAPVVTIASGRPGNQAPSLEGYDIYCENRPLVEAVAREGGGWADERAAPARHAARRRAARAGVGSRTRTRPQLRTHDRFGNRIDEVEFHPAWHRLLGLGGRARAARSRPGASRAPARTSRARPGSSRSPRSRRASAARSR